MKKIKFSSITYNLSLLGQTLVDKKHGYKRLDFDYIAEPICSKDDTSKELRLNLVVPTIDRNQIFGGLSTAFSLFNQLCERLNCRGRVLVLEKALKDKDIEGLGGYTRGLASCSVGDQQPGRPIVVSALPADVTSPAIDVAENDVFVATLWKTYFVADNLSKYQGQISGNAHHVLYLIQDYEPGFFAWSTEYLLCESTYKHPETVAIFNSQQLAQYFSTKGYAFEREYIIPPLINAKIKKELLKCNVLEKDRVCIVYGRPKSERNCFSLILLSLIELTKRHPETSEWQFVSAGTDHDDVPLPNGAVLHSVGKLSIDGYISLLKKASVGISLMCSPHPSYPPLEMSAFGAITITNAFEGKNLDGFNGKIVSVDDATPTGIAETAYSAMRQYSAQVKVTPSDEYLNSDAAMSTVIDELVDYLRNEVAYA